MKKSIYFFVMLFLVFFSTVSLSHGSVLLKKKNTGILVVKTRDTNGNKLGNVPFALDDKEYKTNNKGTKKILVAARETHAIEFGEVEGYIINTPEGGTQTFEIEPGKKKIIVAIYEKTVPATPTPSQTPTPKPTETSIPTPTATVTATPTPKTAVIPWQMFHYNAQHTGQSPYNGPHSNNVKWTYTQSDITEGTVPNSISIDSNGTLYVTAANKLLAIDSDGKLLWSKDVGGIGATAISSDESTIYAVGGKVLYAFSSSGEKQLWSFTEPTDNIYGEPTVGPDGTIYVGSWDTHVYAVNSGGTLKGKYQTDGSIAPLASPTLSNDGNTIYVGSGDRNKDEGGTLYALNSNGTLTLQWKKENLDGARVSGAVVGTDGTIYATGSGKVHAFDKNGNKLWESDKDTASSLTPSLSSDGTLYVGTSGGIVYAINASTGKTKWSYQTGQNPDFTGNPKDPQYGILATIVIGADGIIYVGAMDGVMHALNTDGSVLWKYTTGDNINENCPAIGPDGSLYFSSADKYIYAIKDK
ncbi:MAG: PQQ-binding-like beta-propeller repeat protein [Planctomycetes bacterium]|uniref:outer membrane protein assembly factor BamB family protein n=1 Tax=Candidatus Wunengus californicus TaxID=3367619 RepID=UPI00402877F8|nr:PQQ-binding-like beta-propeller repeat protein [Planctomycetota bacterium]